MFLSQVPERSAPVTCSSQCLGAVNQGKPPRSKRRKGVAGPASDVKPSPGHDPRGLHLSFEIATGPSVYRAKMDPEVKL